MAQRLFRYEVEYYDEYLDEETKECGILTAGSYVNAVMRLCHTEGYGPDLISVKVYQTILKICRVRIFLLLFHYFLVI